MAILMAPDSVEGLERQKWELPKSQGGMNRDGYQEFPKVLYRAGRPTHGNVELTGSRTVHDDREQAVGLGQGWHLTQEAAIQAVHAEHLEHGKLAAERHYTERTMSEAAQREAQAVDAASVYHQPVIPEQPKKKRGRPSRKPEGVN